MVATEPMDIVLMGPPGAGKGTQAERIATAFAIPHISSGEMFRAILAEQSPLAGEIASHVERGAYVPDDLTSDLVLARLRQSDARRGFILDGFPRTIAQAEALDRDLAKRGRSVGVALDITAPTEVLLSRLNGRRHAEQRTDDIPDTVRRRLEVYQRQTLPVIDYYAHQGKLVTVNGANPLPAVSAAVDRALTERRGAARTARQGSSPATMSRASRPAK
ncbi:MAG: adenylate kinase [Chloroflexota bacterium]